MINKPAIRGGGSGGSTGSSSSSSSGGSYSPTVIDPDPEPEPEPEPDPVDVIHRQNQGGGTAQEGSARDDGEQVVEADHGPDRSGFDEWRETETEQRQDLDSHEPNVDYTGPDTGINSSNAPNPDGTPYQGGSRPDDGGDTTPGSTWDVLGEGDGLIGNQGPDDPDNPENDDWGFGEDSAGTEPDWDRDGSPGGNLTDNPALPDAPEWDVPSADDLVPSWLPWAAGGGLGLVVLMVFSYTVGQLFNINVGE